MSGTRHPRVWSDQLIVAIGSLGGLAAASKVVSRLPDGFPVPIVLYLHGPDVRAADPRASLLQRHSCLPVGLGESGRRIPAYGVTVVPYGFCATLDPDSVLHLGEWLPAGGGDELLSSAAKAYGADLTAVVLTGTLSDGAAGVRGVKRQGGRVLVQDPDGARAPSMPMNALATGCVDFRLGVDRIAAALVALTIAPGGAALLAVSTPSWARL